MISIHRHGRHFALYEDETLLAVCCYRKGAEAVKRRLEMILDELQQAKRDNGPSAPAEGAALPNATA